jgi:hypothetical protein
VRRGFLNIYPDRSMSVRLPNVVSHCATTQDFAATARLDWLVALGLISSTDVFACLVHRSALLVGDRNIFEWRHNRGNQI